jgi:hypothetical protein
MPSQYVTVGQFETCVALQRTFSQRDSCFSHALSTRPPPLCSMSLLSNSLLDGHCTLRTSPQRNLSGFLRARQSCALASVSPKLGSVILSARTTVLQSSFAVMERRLSRRTASARTHLCRWHSRPLILGFMVRPVSHPHMSLVNTLHLGTRQD